MARKNRLQDFDHHTARPQKLGWQSLAYALPAQGEDLADSLNVCQCRMASSVVTVGDPAAAGDRLAEEEAEETQKTNPAGFGLKKHLALP
ncbi:hypothetical protein [Streptomyces canus]|uniref:hypothetical protein n=1 Tax=Streptomyces canus TaxID=58343 RepID=UPI0037193E5F